MSEKSTFFKELTPHLYTYELRGQGGKKGQIQDQQTPHTVLQKLTARTTLSESRILMEKLLSFYTTLGLHGAYGNATPRINEKAL